MSVKRNTPEISALRRAVETKSGITPRIYEDFEKLKERIFEDCKEMISASTLQRVWGYSSRSVENLSLNTINILSHYIGCEDWSGFCKSLSNRGESESEMFDIEGISTADLKPGDRLVIGWTPDRLCTVRYLGDNRFLTEEAVNAKLKKGDTFSCLHFELDQPLYLEDLRSVDDAVVGKRYGAALRYGLSVLRKQQNPS